MIIERDKYCAMEMIIVAYPVYLSKEYEDQEIVIYAFCIKRNDQRTGRIQLNKKTQTVTELTPLPEVPSSLSEWALNRAGLRISQCFREGDFPDTTEITH